MIFFTSKLPASLKRGALAVMLACGTLSATAQRVALKTNALYWAAASPNLGLELRVNRHVTLNMESTFNRLKVGKIDTRGFMFAPEARYWFSARPQAGHFLGIMALGANYNLSLDGHHYKGDALGGGLTYGYSFVLGKHWSLETTVGAGAIYRHEKNYKEATEKEPDEANFRKWQLFPLKAGVSFVYIIK